MTGRNDDGRPPGAPSPPWQADASRRRGGVATAAAVAGPGCAAVHLYNDARVQTRLQPLHFSSHFFLL